jgi:hypothetical protein
LRFLTISTPAFGVCDPLTHVNVSENAMSVVGESSDPLAPLKLA